MSLTDVVQGEVDVSPHRRRGHGVGALYAAISALFAAASGLLLTGGIGLVLWAITPTSVGGPQQSLAAAVAAFAAGNGMTLTIGRSALTLPPLMIMVIAVALLAGISGRAPSVADDRTGELTRTATAAAVYAAAVTTAGVLLGSPGAVAAAQWWRPGLLALVVVGTSTLFRGLAWRSRLFERTPAWVPSAVRLGAAGTAGILAAGAAALVVGLVSSFGNSTAVQALAAPGPADGFGMALLAIAFLPNAVLAGAGYATGVGFRIGSGGYSPFGSSPAELPAVSLLAAAPDGREASRVGMVLLLMPVAVALVVGRAAVRRLDSRRERLYAVGAGAALAGLAVGLLAAVAGGGITGGQWASIGAPPLLLGGVTALVLGAFGGAVAGVARESVVTDTDADTGAAREAQAAADEEAGEDGVAEAEAAEDGQPGAVTGAESGPGREAEADAADAGAAHSAEAEKAKPEAANGVQDDTEDAVDDTEDAADKQDAGAHAGADAGERNEAAADALPPAQREEDVLARTSSTDAELVERLQPRPEPRQVG